MIEFKGVVSVVIPDEDAEETPPFFMDVKGVYSINFWDGDDEMAIRLKGGKDCWIRFKNPAAGRAAWGTVKKHFKGIFVSGNPEIFLNPEHVVGVAGNTILYGDGTAEQFLTLTDARIYDIATMMRKASKSNEKG